MVTYASSKFLAASPLESVDLDLVYNSVHDLKSVQKVSTAADMQRLLDEHYFNLTTGSSAPTDDESEDEPIIVTSNNVTNSSTAPLKQTKTVLNETDETTDETLRKLLEDL
jgi:hypothetical protein